MAITEDFGDCTTTISISGLKLLLVFANSSIALLSAFLASPVVAALSGNFSFSKALFRTFVIQITSVKLQHLGKV
jgi:hypothetical protein